MARIAIVNSETLMGRELKEALRARPDLALEVSLFTTEADAVGTLTEGVDGAAFVLELGDDALEQTEIVVICPGPGPASDLSLRPGATVIYLAPTETISDGTVIVSGVNLHQVHSGEVLISPDPTVVALALLLEPLRQYGLQHAACWALLPASVRDQEGIDELLEQSRAVLSFRSDKPTAVFGHQLAFNTLQGSASGPMLAAELKEVLGGDVHPSLQVLQTGTFHGIAAGIQVQLVDAPTPEDLVATLTDGPFFERSEDKGSVGPIAAAGHDRLILGSVEVSPGIPGGLTLWAVMDNLTVGGAANVLGILEALVGPRH